MTEPKSDTPISTAEFVALVAGCPQLEAAQHFAVAVSGGPDSMAAALLAADWVRQSGKQITALTVDHGLRAGSAAECRHVSDWLGQHGIDHQILVWGGSKPASNVQALARKARYGLMDVWCADHGATALVLAHHLEDQAETVLLRLGRGSGVYGLAGMAAATPGPFPGAPVRVRPFLATPKSRLSATLRGLGQDWIEDPSNTNAQFRRVRARGLWPALAQIDVTPERIAATAGHLARAKDAIDHEANALIIRAFRFHSGGYAVLDREHLAAAHSEIGLRALSRALKSIGSGEFGPRFEKLERLYQRICGGDLGRGLTLAGCRIVPDKPIGSDAVVVAREVRSMEGSLALRPQRQVWDGRFLIEPSADLSGARIERLGQAGLKNARDILGNGPVNQCPATARGVLPTILDRDGIIAVPALGYLRPDMDPTSFAIDFLPRHQLPAAAFAP